MGRGGGLPIVQDGIDHDNRQELTPDMPARLWGFMLDRTADGAAARDVGFAGYSRARSERGLRLASDCDAMPLVSRSDLEETRSFQYLVEESRA